MGMNTQVLYPEVEVQLSGEEGNAFAIIARVTRALRNAGCPEEVRAEFRAEATSGDYGHLLQTCRAWVVVS